MTGSRQVPHAEDLATGSTTAGLVPVSAGPGLPAAWGAGGGGGGGGGGVWTQLAQHVVPAGGGEATIDLPALDQGYDHLVVVGDNVAFVNDPTTAGQQVLFQVNGWDASDYIAVRHRVFNVPLSGVSHIAEVQGSEFGLAGWAAWDAAPDRAGFTLWLPGYSNTTTERKSYHTEAGWAYSNLGGVVQAGGHIRLSFAPHVYIDQLTFFAGNLTGTYLFAPGSRLTVYALKNGSSGGSSPLEACAAYCSTGSLTIPTSTVFSVPLDGEESDALGMHDLVTNPNRINILSDGWYDIEANFQWDDIGGSPTSGIRIVGIGSNLVTLARVSLADPTGNQDQCVSWSGTLTAGQWVELFVQHTAGGNMTNSSHGVQHATRLAVAKRG